LDLDAFVVVVDGNRQLLLGLLLTDDILIQEFLDLLWHWQRRVCTPVLEPVVIRDDVVADLDTLVANEDGWSGDELPDIILIFVAKRATEDLGFAAFFCHSHTDATRLAA
jgi:hypothetical protein